MSVESDEYYKICDEYEKLEEEHHRLQKEACRLRLIEKIVRSMVIQRDGDNCSVDAYSAGRLEEVLKLTDNQEDEE
jgi:hypothetical protein